MLGSVPGFNIGVCGMGSDTCHKQLLPAAPRVFSPVSSLLFTLSFSTLTSVGIEHIALPPGLGKSFGEKFLRIVFAFSMHKVLCTFR